REGRSRRNAAREPARARAGRDLPNLGRGRSPLRIGTAGRSPSGAGLVVPATDPTTHSPQRTKPDLGPNPHRPLHPRPPRTRGPVTGAGGRSRELPPSRHV